MRNKWRAAWCALIAAAVLTLGASAAGFPARGGDPSASFPGTGLPVRPAPFSAKKSAAAKDTAAQARQDLNRLRTEENSTAKVARKADYALVTQIAGELRRLSGSAAVNQTDYQEILRQLDAFRTALQSDEAAYQAAAAAYRASDDVSARLNLLENRVIPALRQKWNDLQSWNATLRSLLARADALTDRYGAAAQSSGALVERESAVRSQNETIRQIYSQCRGLISQIAATAAANEKALAGGADATTLQEQLKAVGQQLGTAQSGSIRQQYAAFCDDRKSDDIAGAAAQLDRIVSLQKERIAALAGAKTQLQNVLDRLNALVNAAH